MKLIALPPDAGFLRLQCEGEITLTDFRPGIDPIQSLLGHECFSKRVLFSLERATFVDSSGIGWLLNSHKHFLQGGGVLVLHSIPPMVKQVLNLLRMELVLLLADDEADAKARANKEKP